MARKVAISLHQTGNNDSFGIQLFGVLKLLESFDSIDFETLDVLTVDWGQVKFIHPTFILPTAALLKSISEEYTVAIQHANLDDNLNSYLNTIGFLESLKSDSDLILSNRIDKSYLPILRFTGSDRNSEFAEKVTTNFQGWLSNQELDNSIKTGIIYVISELVDNVLEHSNSRFGWISSQRFSTKGFLDICLVDRGIGLKQSYNNTGFIVHDHMDAIKQALKGISTKNIKERGYGLRTSISAITKGISGRFMVVTGNAIFNNGEIASFKGHWNGVLCTIRLNIDVDDFNLYDFVE